MSSGFSTDTANIAIDTFKLQHVNLAYLRSFLFFCSTDVRLGNSLTQSWRFNPFGIFLLITFVKENIHVNRTSTVQYY